MVAQHSTSDLRCIAKLFKIQGVVHLIEMLVLISMFPVKRRTPTPIALNSSSSYFVVATIFMTSGREQRAANRSKVDTAEIYPTLCQLGLINTVLRALVTIRHFASALKAALGLRDCSQKVRFSRAISDYHLNFKRCESFRLLAN